MAVRLVVIAASHSCTVLSDRRVAFSSNALPNATPCHRRRKLLNTNDAQIFSPERWNMSDECSSQWVTRKVWCYAEVIMVTHGWHDDERASPRRARRCFQVDASLFCPPLVSCFSPERWNVSDECSSQWVTRKVWCYAEVIMVTRLARSRARFSEARPPFFPG